MTLPARDQFGRFEPGSRANPSGRPPAARTVGRLSAELRDLLLDIAAQPVVFRGKAEPIRSTYFQARVLELASGRPRSRLACKMFIETVLLAASQAKASNASSSPFAALHWAIEHGTDADFEAALEAQIQALPGPTGLSDRDLADTLRDLRGWRD